MLDLVCSTGFDQAFMFAYSSRDRTHAARHLQVGHLLCLMYCLQAEACLRGCWCLLLDLLRVALACQA